jgi:hypothetical protein
MEHFQFSMKLVPALYDTEQITGNAFKYRQNITGGHSAKTRDFLGGEVYFTTLSVSTAQCPMVRRLINY